MKLIYIVTITTMKMKLASLYSLLMAGAFPFSSCSSLQPKGHIPLLIYYRAVIKSISSTRFTFLVLAIFLSGCGSSFDKGDNVWMDFASDVIATDTYLTGQVMDTNDGKVLVQADMSKMNLLGASEYNIAQQFLSGGGKAWVPVENIKAYEEGKAAWDQKQTIVNAMNKLLNGSIDEVIEAGKARVQEIQQLPGANDYTDVESSLSLLSEYLTIAKNFEVDQEKTTTSEYSVSANKIIDIFEKVINENQSLKAQLIDISNNPSAYGYKRNQYSYLVRAITLISASEIDLILNFGNTQRILKSHEELANSAEDFGSMVELYERGLGLLAPDSQTKVFSSTGQQIIDNLINNYSSAIRQSIESGISLKDAQPGKNGEDLFQSAMAAAEPFDKALEMSLYNEADKREFHMRLARNMMLELAKNAFQKGQIWSGSISCRAHKEQPNRNMPAFDHPKVDLPIAIKVIDALPQLDIYYIAFQAQHPGAGRWNQPYGTSQQHAQLKVFPEKQEIVILPGKPTSNGQVRQDVRGSMISSSDNRTFLLQNGGLRGNISNGDTVRGKVVPRLYRGECTTFSLSLEQNAT